MAYLSPPPTGGALAEVCGDAALLFDPDDGEAMLEAMRRVTGDEALRVRLRAAGPCTPPVHLGADRTAHVEAYAQVARATVP